MKSILALCTLCCALALAGPASAAQILSLHGDFLQWEAVAPTKTYADVDLPADYKAREREAETPYAEPFMQMNVHLGADGTILRSGSWARYYLTQNGVQRSGNLTFWVDSFSEIATIEQAYTLLPDGRRLDVDPASVQLIQEVSDDIFSDAYEVVVPFFGLEKDAIAVLAVRTEERPGVWPLPWSRVIYPQVFAPRREFQFDLTWDEGVEAPLWRTDYADFDCATPSPRHVHCQAEDIAVYPEDPNVYYRDVLPSLVVAEQVSWQDLAGMVGAFVDSAITDDATLDLAMDRILAGAEDDRERLSRIHQFVSQDIRYIGLEQGLGGIIPRPAAQTLASRFGDCKDKTTLFIALARRAGMDAYAVLTTFNRFDPAKLLLPGTSYFDHMVACVRLDSGEEYCVDLTDPHNPHETLSSSLSGAIRFDLVKSPPTPGAFDTPEYGWVVKVTSDYTYLDNGDIEEHQSLAYGGPYAGDIRGTLLSRDRSQRNEWLTNRYHDTVSNRVDPAFELRGLDDVGSQVRIESRVRHRDAFNPSGPGDFVSWQDWLAYEARSSRSDNLHHTYRFPGLRYTERAEYRLPESLQLGHLGAQISFETPFGTFRRNSRHAGDALSVVTELTIPRIDIPPERLAEFNAFIDYIGDNARIVFSAE